MTSWLLIFEFFCRHIPLQIVITAHHLFNRLPPHRIIRQLVNSLLSHWSTTQLPSQSWTQALQPTQSPIPWYTKPATHPVTFQATKYTLLNCWYSIQTSWVVDRWDQQQVFAMGDKDRLLLVMPKKTKGHDIVYSIVGLPFPNSESAQRVLQWIANTPERKMSLSLKMPHTPPVPHHKLIASIFWSKYLVLHGHCHSNSVTDCPHAHPQVQPLDQTVSQTRQAHHKTPEWTDR